MRSDAEIVRAVLAGDRDAFAALAERHERVAWATAWQILRDDHAASDAAQEAFLHAYRRLGGLRDPANFGVWLARIARREAIRIARKRPTRSLSIREELAQPEDDTALDRRDAELLDAVGRLKEHERVVVVLFYLEGRPVAEIAEALGRPVGTVTKQLSRAVMKLRDLLGVRGAGMYRGRS